MADPYLPEETIAAWHASRRYASVPEGEIAYYERGEGDVALFIHGFPLNSLHWWRAVDRLAPARRCIALDLLAHGHTRVSPGANVALPDQARMIVAFLDTLGIQAVDLVGNDSGTGIAQLLAVGQPERVRSMLLTNGDVEPDTPPAPLLPVVRLAKAGRFADEVIMPSLRDKEAMRSPQGVGGLTYTVPERLGDAAIEAYFVPLVASAERKAQIDAYAASLDPNPLAGIEAALRACRAPTRIVWGMGDVMFSPEDPAYLDRILPASRGVRAVPDAKLFFPEEMPEIVAEEAVRLWRASATSGPHRI